MSEILDAVVIGGGQAGLSTAYFLRRNKRSFVVLDDQDEAGAAWLHAWKSLKLFSPAEASSLPGWRMPWKGYPDRDQVISYLSQYEKKYDLPLRRPVRVVGVHHKDALFEIECGPSPYSEEKIEPFRIKAKVVVAATGTWQQPRIPEYPGLKDYQGEQLHSAFYTGPEGFAGKKIVIVGGGNSGAQILADLSKVADCTWATLEEPVFLPDEVDGRFLFLQANAKFRAAQSGEAWQRDPRLKKGLSAIVMVDSVKEARERNALKSRRTFCDLWEKGVIWPDGSREAFDLVLWCTGFKSSLNLLKPLQLENEQGRIETEGSRALNMPGLWLVGYGNWTGWASATLMGVQRHAKKAAKEINEYLEEV